MTWTIGIHKKIIERIANINFMSLATIASEKSSLPFPHTKAQVTEFDLAVK